MKYILFILLSLYSIIILVSITYPTTSSLIETSKYSSNSSSKPPYKSLDKGSPKGYYTIKKDLDNAYK